MRKHLKTCTYTNILADKHILQTMAFAGRHKYADIQTSTYINIHTDRQLHKYIDRRTSTRIHINTPVKSSINKHTCAIV